MALRKLVLIAALILAGRVPRASAQGITEFPLPNGSNAPSGIAAGPDGNMWFTEISVNPRIGRLDLAILAIAEFPIPTPEATPAGIVAGPDGNLWFTQADFEFGFEAASISRITPEGNITQFPGPRFPSDITVGPDGNLWFTESNINANRIGRMTTAGVLTFFPIPTPGYPWGITSGPDGNLWFTEILANKIGRITTAGVITEFPLPTTASAPLGITAGPDGNVWFAESRGNKIGRITTAGAITEFSIPTVASGPRGITAGPDRNVWFTEESANKIGRITTSGVVTEFPILTPASRPIGITAGPDGNVWFTEFSGNRIGRLIVGGAQILDTRILPVVGSTPGVGATFYKTSVQLHNPTGSAIAGRIVFHPSGAPGSGSDPALSYTLSPGQTQSIADLLPAMGRSGLGSVDIEVTSGVIPALSARVFNDAGAAGTTGFTEEPMRAEDALSTGQSGVLLFPADLANFRFNLGVRTLEAGAGAILTLRDSAGTVVATVSRAFAATYHEQQSASELLGIATLPPGGSLSVSVGFGAAIFYGATVDNRTGDPSLQIARASGPWDY